MREFAEQVLALARRSATWAEVFMASEEVTPVGFEANHLRSIDTRESRGVALRVVVDGRIGFASSSMFDDPQGLVDDCLATARFGARSEIAYPSARVGDTALDLYDEAIAAMGVDALVQLGQQLLDRVRARGDDILCDVDVRRSISAVAVANSSGGQGSYRRTVLAMGLRANRVRDTDMLDIYESDSSCRWRSLHMDAMVETVLTKLDLSEVVVPARTGVLPVIFTPKGAATTLLAPLVAALSGKAVLEGSSPLAGRLGEILFDSRFTLTDDGLVPGSPASAPCDGEGVPTRRTALVEQGRVNAYYYDLQTAGRAGTESTGNGERGPSSLPSPGTHALRISAGDVPYEAMLAGIKEGLVVDQTMGAWAGNMLSGEFSGNVHLGFKVEGGRLVGRVKDTMVAGNVFRALAKLAGVGDRAYWIGGGAELPYLCFAELSVATR